METHLGRPGTLCCEQVLLVDRRLLRLDGLGREFLLCKVDDVFA